MKTQALFSNVCAMMFLWAGFPARSETLSLEKFEGAWDWSEGNNIKGVKDYNVVKEAGHAYLHATYLAGSSGKPIYKKISWNTDKWPWLRWKWRVESFTKGAKILESAKSDCPAQIYVTWKLGGRAMALKYFWAELDPVGMTFRKGDWNPLGKYQGLVIRSGGKTHEWMTEVRNLKEDFKTAYGKDPPETAVGIGVLTDGDQTETLPVADYADFEALSEDPSKATAPVAPSLPAHK